MNSGTTSFYGIVFQAEDMDLTNTNFTPIGTEEHPFEGIFEGPSEADKAEISINLTANQNHVGLFGVIGNNAEIRNISLTGNVENTMTEEADTTPSAGLVAGKISGNALIENCIANGSVKALRAGGIVGDQDGGTIRNVLNYATVTATDSTDGSASYAGGITGSTGTSDGSGNATIEGSQNFGNVTESEYVGGITGIAFSSSLITDTMNGDENTHPTITGNSRIGGIAGNLNASIISSSFNYADIVANGERIGGIAGTTGTDDPSTIRGCENHGNITADGSTYVGGIIGTLDAGSTVSTSHNYGEVSGTKQVGGIAGNATENSSISESTNNEAINGRLYIGGIVGFLTDSTVNSAENTGNVSGTSQIGGIVGKFQKSGTASTAEPDINEVENSGEVKGSSEIGGIAGNFTKGKINGAMNSASISGSEHIGGITGNLSESEIIDAENSGSIKANSQKAGGIAGTASGSIINEATNTSGGTVSAPSHTGGIIGYMQDGSEVNTVTNEATVTATAPNSYAGGIIGRIVSKDSQICQIIEAKSSATIIGETRYGGLIGTIEGEAMISESTSVSDLTENNTNRVGPFMGGLLNNSKATISNCQFGKENNGVADINEENKGNAIGFIATSATLEILTNTQP